MIHGELDTAVQAKSLAFAAIVTVLPNAPLGPTLTVPGLRVTIPVIPGCVRVKVLFPIVIVAVLAFTDGFAP